MTTRSSRRRPATRPHRSRSLAPAPRTAEALPVGAARPRGQDGFRVFRVLAAQSARPPGSCQAGYPGRDLADTALSLVTTRAVARPTGPSLLAADRDDASPLAPRRPRGTGRSAPGTCSAGTVRRRTPRRRSSSPDRAAQRPGMGSGLYAAFPGFASALDAVLRTTWTCTWTARCGTSMFTVGDGLDDTTGTPGTEPDRLHAEPPVRRSRWRSTGCWRAGFFTPDVLGGPLGRRTRPRPMSPECCPCPTPATLVAARGRLMQALPAGRGDDGRAGHRGGSAAAARGNRRSHLLKQIAALQRPHLGGRLR